MVEFLPLSGRKQFLVFTIMSSSRFPHKQVYVVTYYLVLSNINTNRPTTVYKFAVCVTIHITMYLESIVITYL